MSEQTCAQCGLPYPLTQARCPRCQVDVTGGGEQELELDWGDRRRPGTAAPEEVVNEPLEALPPVDEPAPSKQHVDFDASNFDGFVRITDMVLLVGLIFELASGGLSLMGAILRGIGAATSDVYLPSTSRGVVLFTSVAMAVMWSGMMLRVLRARADLTLRVTLMWLLPFTPGGRKGWDELAHGLEPRPRPRLIVAALLLACGGWLAWGVAVKVLAVPVKPAGLLLEFALALAAAFGFARLRAFIRRFHGERDLSAEEPEAEPVAEVPPPVAEPVVAAPSPVPVVVAVPVAVPEPPPIAGPPVPCLVCGAAISPNDATCPFCKTLQLFDVVGSSVANEKERYALARQLAAAGVPGLDFKAALERLKQPKPVIATAIARPLALKLVDVLAARGTRGRMEPSRKRTRAPRLALQVAVAVVALGWVGFSFLRRPKDTEDLASMAKKSTVTVFCDDSLGTGFVIAKDLIATNEHVACVKGSKMSVLFPDGRKYDATLRVFDDWLDIAVLDVPGAGDVALELGDATKMREGSRVMMVGAPKGLSFTVHEGLISHIGRTHLGITYLQFDANVNPGNSGGPLLDMKGNVIGIVSQRLDDAEGIGFALPINYLRDPRLVPAGLAAPPSPEWRLLLDAAHEDERKELASVREAEQRTEVVRLIGTSALVATRSESRPPRRQYELNLEIDGRRACEAHVSSSEWKAVELDQPRMGQRLRWMQKNGLLSGLHVASVPLLSECTAQASSGSEIVLIDGATELLRLPLR